MKLSKTRIILFSFMHLAVLMVFYIFSFMAGMDAFDGKKELTAFDKLAGNITELFMSPLFMIWNEWEGASKYIPDFIEILLFFLNSVLWGVIIESIYSKYRGIKGKKVKD